MSPSIDRLRTIAAQLCSASAMERLIAPTLADMIVEHCAAVRRHRTWRGRWILLAGWFTVLKLAAFSLTAESLAAFVDRGSDDGRSMRRVLIVFGGVTVAATLLLELMTLGEIDLSTEVGRAKAAYLAPSAVPLAVCAAVPVAILVGLARRALSVRVGMLVVALAVGCSTASFAVLGWLMPAANQAFRVQVFAETTGGSATDLPKGTNELTLTEVPTRIDEVRAFDPQAPARDLFLSYHTRWALALTPLALAVLSLIVVWRSAMGRAGHAAVALGICVGYAVVLAVGRSLGMQGALAPSLAAWLPNVVVTALILLAVRVRSRSAGTTARAT